MKNIWYILLVFAFLSNSYAQSWQKIAPMPGGARDAIICFSIGNVIYSGGGPKKDFYAYDAQKGSWTRKADLPGVGQNRAFSFSFSIAGKGYIGTGTDSGVSILKSDLWEYDPSLNSWIQKADFPGGDRDGLGVFVVNGKAYVGGGADAALNVYSDFYEYDPAENKWNMKAELPGGPNIFASMFAIGNYGYLACGSGIVEYQDLYRYDPTMDSWDALSPLPGDARQAGIGFVLRGKGYVGLGMSGYSTVYTDMYSYDPAKDEWSPETDLPATG
ncbi:MAG: kelch repeat-containing protein, partial [Bacteroidota bacterium]|nr:kelch repeat-containing protein [Bacteroidota bacterium]